MTNGRRILIADNDPALLDMLTEQLQRGDEYIAVIADSGIEALTLAKKEPFDAFIIEISLKDIYGLQICKNIRQKGSFAPIITLGEPCNSEDEKLSLDLGANDHLTKPFRIGLLLTRLRALIRHQESNASSILKIGHYSFQPSNNLLQNIADNENVRLTDKEVEILQYLHRARDQIVGRDVLLSEVWGYKSNIKTHTLETHIYRLRQKIEKDPTSAEIIVTERGGYRLVLSEGAD